MVSSAVSKKIQLSNFNNMEYNRTTTNTGRLLPVYRVGSTFEVLWEILTNGEKESLEGRNLKLYLTAPNGRMKHVVFTIKDDNNICFRFEGVEQNEVGDYKLTLVENQAEQTQEKIDLCPAFRLVHCSHEVPPYMDALTTIGTGNILTGLAGKSAYQAAVEHGYDGTEEQFGEDMAHMPENSEAAKAAAELADEAAKHPAIIGENENWWIWDAETKQYVDSGKPSRGESAPDSYTELKNKPSVEGVELLGDKTLKELGLLNADWNETNPDSYAFIKNKPDTMDIFFVQYGATKFADIQSAILKYKYIACFYQNRVYTLKQYSSSQIFLQDVMGATNYGVVVTSANAWSTATVALENTANKATAIDSTSTDAQYP